MTTNAVGAEMRLSVGELAALVSGRAHTCRPGQVDELVVPAIGFAPGLVRPGQVLLVPPGTPPERARALTLAGWAAGAGAVLLEDHHPVPAPGAIGGVTITVHSTVDAAWRLAQHAAALQPPDHDGAGATVLALGGPGKSTALRVLAGLLDLEPGRSAVLAAADVCADLALPAAFTQACAQRAPFGLYEANGEHLIAPRTAVDLLHPDVLVVLPLEQAFPPGITPAAYAHQVLAVTQQMDKRSVVVLCTDDPELRAIASRIEGPQVVTVGMGDTGAVLHAGDVEPVPSTKEGSLGGVRVTISWRGRTSRVLLPAAGRSCVITHLAGFTAWLAATGWTTPGMRHDVTAYDFEFFAQELATVDPRGPGRMGATALAGGGLLLDNRAGTGVANLLAGLTGLDLAARRRPRAAVLGRLRTGADPAADYARAGWALAAHDIDHLLLLDARPDDPHARALSERAAAGGVGSIVLLPNQAGPDLDKTLTDWPAGTVVLLQGEDLDTRLPLTLAAHFATRLAAPHSTVNRPADRRETA
ncbi:hypothetical protein [Kitasatospora sp. NPDC088134]|uniref:hypothetical protein n=1 Tax=Kitasatospora sp. NPDC088134 TaxID=3364071 RepID=UPI0038172442